MALFADPTGANIAVFQLGEHPGALGEVFNLGNSHEITILELAQQIKKQLGSSSKIVLVPYDEAYEEGFEDMRRRAPDTSKVHALIGFAPKHDLDGIIRDVADFMREDR